MWGDVESKACSHPYYTPCAALCLFEGGAQRKGCGARVTLPVVELMRLNWLLNRPHHLKNILVMLRLISS
jgi:hypothetical protein